MKIRSAEFVASAVAINQYPVPVLPKVCFLGRSNVGKSSLINTLLNRKSLARTSSRPGKTQTVNFYRINDEFDLVDLPGYGYAKVPAAVHREMQSRIGVFLDHLDELKGIIQLIDSRHPPTTTDVTLGNWIKTLPVQATWVLVKVDKISNPKRNAAVAEVKSTLALPPDAAVVLFSSVDRTGRLELLNLITQMVAKTGTQTPGK